jgi:hypothetical protein
VTGHLSKGLRAATFLSIAIVSLTGGCNHSRSTPEGVIAVPDEVSQVSPALVGKQITIHGKFSLWGKIGPYIWLANQQAVYLVPRGSFTWGKPYSEMEGKLATATGILKFCHGPDAKPRDETVQHAPDFFYFELENTQLRLVGR